MVKELGDYPDVVDLLADLEHWLNELPGHVMDEEKLKHSLDLFKALTARLSGSTVHTDAKIEETKKTLKESDY